MSSGGNQIAGTSKGATAAGESSGKSATRVKKPTNVRPTPSKPKRPIKKEHDSDYSVSDEVSDDELEDSESAHDDVVVKKKKEKVKKALEEPTITVSSLK